MEVFLLTLASGKGRSGIRVGFFSPLYKENWSQVALAILAKNQLALDGPTSVKPVVMPALNHWDSSFTRDRSLCLVRVLKYFYIGQRIQ